MRVKVIGRGMVANSMAGSCGEFGRIGSANGAIGSVV
jgi:hypothetical protein